jgi:hypothetical protein
MLVWSFITTISKYEPLIEVRLQPRWLTSGLRQKFCWSATVPVGYCNRTSKYVPLWIRTEIQVKRIDCKLFFKVGFSRRSSAQTANVNGFYIIIRSINFRYTLQGFFPTVSSPENRFASSIREQSLQRSTKRITQIRWWVLYRFVGVQQSIGIMGLAVPVDARFASFSYVVRLAHVLLATHSSSALQKVCFG